MVLKIVILWFSWFLCFLRTTGSCSASVKVNDPSCQVCLFQHSNSSHPFRASRVKLHRLHTSWCQRAPSTPRFAQPHFSGSKRDKSNTRNTPKRCTLTLGQRPATQEQAHTNMYPFVGKNPPFELLTQGCAHSRVAPVQFGSVTVSWWSWFLAEVSPWISMFERWI